MIPIPSISYQLCQIDCAPMLQVGLCEALSIYNNSCSRTGHQYGVVCAENGYALAITRTDAIIWPYAAVVQFPETFTFKLPYPAKHVSDPLPLGSFVSPSASASEPGLVVIAPTSGKITYWESITSATTLDLIRQQRNGVEFNIIGMLSGETVTQIVNAESAGFVIGFSTGRIAYMSVRDGQGRPAISTHFLRNNNATVGSGIFGSIRKVLTHSAWSGDVAAIRAGPSTKVGERDFVVTTERGKLQAWTIHRGGHNTLRMECEGREFIFRAICDVEPAFVDVSVDTLKVLDFAFTPKSNINVQSSSNGKDEGQVLLLAALTRGPNIHFFLVDVVLWQDDLSIGNVRQIKSYISSVSKSAMPRIRLYLPNPALVAYVVIERAVVIMSMAKQPESPDAQLQLESHLQPRYFEDVVDFRNDANVEIVGSGMEEPQLLAHGDEESKIRRHKAKHPATVLLVRGGGIIRIAATDTAKLVSTKAPQVTAKSKLEQAVFFSKIEKTPLSFAVRSELKFPAKDVGEAALELSSEILQCRNPNITFTASIEQNLRQRATALRILADHLKVNGVELDRVTRWQLLWDAEKIAAASTIWEQYDARLRTQPSSEERGLLPEIISHINENQKTDPIPEAGELDAVRHWFMKDVWNLQVALPWAFQVIKYAYNDGKKDRNYVAQLVIEASDLVIGALNRAYEFRAANLAVYGLQNEQLDLGVLQNGYEDLPEMWTSRYVVAENLRKQYELAGYFMQGDQEGEGVEQSRLNAIHEQYPDLLDVAIRSNEERIRWATAQDHPALQIHAEQIEQTMDVSEDKHLNLLASEMESPDAAMDLAEKYGRMTILASILVSEIAMCKLKFRAQPFHRAQHGYRLEQLQHRLEEYFNTFGTPWATALYENYVEADMMTDLLDAYPNQHAYLTTFLNSKPEYAKVAWIQEVIREGNFEAASKILIQRGRNREQNVWSKKVELSIGKLCALVGKEETIIQHGGLQDMGLQATDKELGILAVQERLYQYILPSISNALDESAEIQLVKDAHGNPKLKGQHALQSLVDEGLTDVLRHKTIHPLTLIDVLTLICQHGPHPDGNNFIDMQFFFALNVATCMSAHPDEFRLTQQLVWRRCLLKDSWKAINNTVLKDDESLENQLRQTVLYHTVRACYRDGRFSPQVNVNSWN